MRNAQEPNLRQWTKLEHRLTNSGPNLEIDIMRKIIFVIGAALVMAGCDNAQVVANVDSRKISYTQDVRTGLCFATVGRAESALAIRVASLSFTHVPCTPEVLAQIRRG